MFKNTFLIWLGPFNKFLNIYNGKFQHEHMFWFYCIVCFLLFCCFRYYETFVFLKSFILSFHMNLCRVLCNDVFYFISRCFSACFFFILAQPNWPLTVVKLKEVTAFEDRWIRSSRRLLVWTSECFFATNCFLFVTRYRFVREINFIHSFIHS